MKRLAAALVSTMAFLTGVSYAQSYPAKPVRIIVPYGAGGSTDATARVLAASLTTTLGQTVIVENIGGAAGALGYNGLERIIVAMGGGFLLVASVSDGSCVGVVAKAGCDIGAVGYQMTLLVERAGEMLTPELVDELKNLVLVR